MKFRLFFCGLFAGALAVLAALWPRGVEVTVTNQGTVPIEDLVVFVTGNSYHLGVLGVGQSKTVSVEPKGESHVELEFTGSDGERHRLNAGGYFESGYQTTIEIELSAGEIIRYEQRFRPWLVWE